MVREKREIQHRCHHTKEKAYCDWLSEEKDCDNCHIKVGVSTDKDRCFICEIEDLEDGIYFADKDIWFCKVCKKRNFEEGE